MRIRSKQAITPYEPLRNFVNADIQDDTWEEICRGLQCETPQKRHPAGQPIPHFDLIPPILLEGQSLTGKSIRSQDGRSMTRIPVSPEVLRLVRELQRELKADLERLIASPAKYPWLVQKIVSPHSDGTPLHLEVGLGFPQKEGAGPLFFDIIDLRDWVYFCLALLRAEGLFHRIGFCQNPKCRQFFLAKTKRKDRRYCSTRCAQAVTAPDRTKATRVRRAAWESIREDLERALKGRSPEILRKAITKAERAFAEAYPRQKGPGYEEGKRLLARAKKQLR